MLNALEHTIFRSLHYYIMQRNSMILSLSHTAEFREFQVVLFQAVPSSALQLFFLPVFFASIRSPLSSAEILYFPEKCSPDSGRDYSPFFVRKVLPLRTETQASNISSYKSVPYSRILKQTEMRLSHFFLISRIFSENIFVFFYVNLLKP